MGEPRLKSGGRRAKIEAGLFAAAVIDLADSIWLQSRLDYLKVNANEIAGNVTV